MNGKSGVDVRTVNRPIPTVLIMKREEERKRRKTGVPSKRPIVLLWAGYVNVHGIGYTTGFDEYKHCLVFRLIKESRVR